MKVGICGYGNLGKAVEKIILDFNAKINKNLKTKEKEIDNVKTQQKDKEINNVKTKQNEKEIDNVKTQQNEKDKTETKNVESFYVKSCARNVETRNVETKNVESVELVAIFSRRKVKSKFNSLVLDYSQAKNFAGKIDVMFMCGGSKTDLMWQSVEMVKYFNIIDSFDTHAKILEHKTNLQQAANQSGKVAIYSCGWDPGIFSLMRTLFAAVLNVKAHTFWGKGVSQGHSQALRNIDGVADAIQFTIPNKQILNAAKHTPNFCANENQKHIRQCYVCLDETKTEDEVKCAICNTENYFKGQPVEIEFCGKQKINRLSKKMYHKGCVFALTDSERVNFEVKMKNNPQFTAKIMFAFCAAIKRLNPGAHSVLDIPLSFLLDSANNLI